MDFLKSQKRFDFLYDGVPFSECDYTVEQTESGNTLTTVYTMKDGLKITNIAEKKDSAYEWVNWWENTSDTSSKIISELWDCSVSLPMEYEDPPAWTSYMPNRAEQTLLHSYRNFAPTVTPLLPGKHMDFASYLGRSSYDTVPFFNIHKKGRGYIFAVGWTGQWNARVSRTEDTIEFNSKIEDTHFRLLPGEKIRTSSVVIMPYEGSVVASQNQWRSLVRNHYSLIGKEGREKKCPLSAGFWGGMHSDIVFDRIKVYQDNNIPVEYVWMDAGWYGPDTLPTPDEYEGGSWCYTGDWSVSPKVHPGQLKDISKTIHDGGMKFLLWFEPERVFSHMPIVKEHPEYFFKCDYPDGTVYILNLGDPEAWNYCLELLSTQIRELGIDCYRQDFNFNPLPVWQYNDAEDRKGISEIKHIEGLYRLWDTLLERFPNMLIDNCASGGCRIDIETLRRSVPLWRSDLTCSANFPSTAVQCHHLDHNLWLPYSGNGTGRIYDTYRLRSTYSPGMNFQHAWTARETFGDDSEKIEWMKKYLTEFIKVREYMDEDFYPLTEIGSQDDIWAACQFDRPSKSDGMVQVFRRASSPYKTACFSLGNVDENCTYTFTDANNEQTWRVSGKDLVKDGFVVTLEEKRSSNIFFYTYA